MQPTHVVSTIALALIALGLLMLRRSPKAHVACMLGAFALDVALVLYIELTRGAIEQAVKVPPALMSFHIAVSVATLVLYVVQIWLGAKLLKGQQASRATHKWCGIAFLVCRLANYVTSFMV